MASIRATNWKAIRTSQGGRLTSFATRERRRRGVLHTMSQHGPAGWVMPLIPFPQGASTVLPAYESSAYQSVYLLQRPRNELAR
jgi:hypothetical protein